MTLRPVKQKTLLGEFIEYETEEKITKSTVYAGDFFTISVSEADIDKHDNYTSGREFKNFITGKMRVKNGYVPEDDEGEAYARDLSLFLRILAPRYWVSPVQQECNKLEKVLKENDATLEVVESP